MGNSAKNVDFATKIEGFDYLRKEKYIKNTIDRSRILFIRFAIMENAAFCLIRKRAPLCSIGMSPLCLWPTRP